MDGFWASIGNGIAAFSDFICGYPLFFLLNSYTTGLQAGVLTHMLKTALAPKRPAYVESGEIGLPIHGTDLILPCGAAGRVVF